MANEQNLPDPITRDEKYLAKAAGVEVDIPTPITREEKYLNAIAEGGGGGGGFTPTEQQLTAMNSGITATDVEQIETNKTNILSVQNKTVGMDNGGANYISVNGIKMYFSTTAPTGASVGDLWVGG